VRTLFDLSAWRRQECLSYGSYPYDIMDTGIAKGQMVCGDEACSPRPLVLVRRLSKIHKQNRWFAPHKFPTKSLDRLCLDITEGSTLALVGESGSGKSTLARCLALLEKPTEGEIWFEGKDLLSLPARQARHARRQIQLVFQEPATALNPRLKALEVVAEPLEITRQGTKAERRDRAFQLLEEVGLSPQCGGRSPLEFSGGQRQRLALARALAVRPKVLILDEVFSGLDLPLRAQIAALLGRLRERWKLTYLLISHDLGLVCRLADETAVLYRGKLVELGKTDALLSAPAHPHTQALVAATLRFEIQPSRL
jgi:ABC-type glutathione transport system ATPase component